MTACMRKAASSEPLGHEVNIALGGVIPMIVLHVYVIIPGRLFALIQHMEPIVSQIAWQAGSEGVGHISEADTARCL